MPELPPAPAERLAATLSAAVICGLIPRSGRPATMRASNGTTCLVDEEDLSWCLTRRWHTHKSGRNVYFCTSYSAGLHVSLHNHILVARPRSGAATIDVHHRDGDSLNNRRQNLEYLPHSTNVSLGRRRND